MTHLILNADAADAHHVRHVAATVITSGGITAGMIGGTTAGITEIGGIVIKSIGAASAAPWLPIPVRGESFYM